MGRLIVLALCLAASPVIMAADVKADFFTGNNLLTSCSQRSLDSCTTYVFGVVDMIAAAQRATGALQAICIPEEVTGGQVRDLAIKYFKDHPEDRHLAAASQIWLALYNAYPCAKKN